MRDGHVVVLGSGVAGMAAALLLAREGHHVTVVERDPFEIGEPLAAPGWRRKGIPHFHQPHAFIPRGRSELRTNFPDVYHDLLAAGARDADLRPKLPGDLRPEDEELQYLAVRRPLIEWGLRRAVAAETRIDVVAGAQATGVTIEGGRVGQAQLDGAAMSADLVVDALGRRTPGPRWLQALGAGEEEMARSDCGVIYYCRYYRQRDGFELPDGPWLLSPRGSLGYLAYSSFPGDNRTFAAVLAVPPGVAAWRMLKDRAAFEAAVATIPALRAWVDPEGVEPMTDVLTMAGLGNSLRRYDPAGAPGYVPVGDAMCHTDPVLAHGLAFALIHAAALAKAVREHDDLRDVGQSYTEAVMPAVRERFAFATELDEQRLRGWLGEPVDPAHPEGDYALFTMVAGMAAATMDPEVFRVFVRRIGLLDSTKVLDDDLDLQRRIEGLFDQYARTLHPAAGPGKDEMLSIAAAAAG